MKKYNMNNNNDNDKYVCANCGKPLRFLGLLELNQSNYLQKIMTSINNSEEILNCNIDLSIYDKKDICKVFLNALNEKANNEFLKRKLFEKVQKRFNVENIDNVYIYDTQVFFHED